MIWIYKNEEPPKVEKSLFMGQWKYSVNYAIEALPAGEQFAYRYKQVSLEAGVWHYGAIINALVTAEYPLDKMQAVVNNYLAFADNAEVKADFDAMQAWRAEAKAYAKVLLAEYPPIE